ncbi:ChbG/HpnK family deacetylase [archaeon]|nr:ChbG/HpnK family deacetylase [archaeon]
MNLIINADDFGLDGELNSRIIELHKKGIVKGASLLANGKAFENAAALAKDCPLLDIGIHLNLTEGESLTGGPKELVKHGYFKGAYSSILKIIFGLVNKKELENEIQAQIEKVVNSGINPSYIDWHHHIIVFPLVWNITKRIAEQYRIKRFRVPYERFGLSQTASFMNLVNWLGISCFAFRLRKYMQTSLFFGILRMKNITADYLDWILKQMKNEQLRINKKNKQKQTSEVPITAELAVHLQSDKDLKTLRELSPEILEKGQG